ncbi:olfactory receptor 4N2-like [Thomomys bottae]
MEPENYTMVTEFVLIGLSQTREIQLILFVIFLSFYLFILPGNILIICTIKLDPHLTSPMYFLLANLAFLDIWYSSITAPKMLVDFFVERKTISFGGCIAQLFFLHFVGASEMFLLTVMAFDRYAAICRPLHYATIMNRSLCCILVALSWMGGFIHSIIQVALIIRLPFCGPNELDNYFCDITQVVRIACANTFLEELVMIFSSGLISVVCFIALLVSYAFLLAMLKKHSGSVSEDAGTMEAQRKRLQRSTVQGMERVNNTMVTEFILLGLTQSRDIQLLVFVLILIFYLIILPGNILIILTIRSDSTLTAPLYFFLSNLAFLDASYSFIVAPRMLVDFLSEKKVISYQGCITQLFFLHFLGGGEGLLLVVMAFDRYMAICRPLHYSTVMCPRTCYAMLMALWLGGFVHSIIQVILILRLPFCGPNQLDNFFCDVPQVIKLACTDTFVVELLMVFNSGLMTLLCFLGLLVSYAVILCRVHQSSSEGKNKAMSTCTTHVIVVFLMFGPGIFIYTRPFRALPADKVVSFFHTVIFPLLNPVIYTLRNNEVKISMKKLLTKYIIY